MATLIVINTTSAPMTPPTIPPADKGEERITLEDGHGLEIVVVALEMNTKEMLAFSVWRCRNTE